MTDSAFETYHRNGVSGLGFYVGIAEGALCVEFPEFIDEHKDPSSEWIEQFKYHRIAVDLDNLVKLPKDGHKELPCVSDCEGSAWLVRGKMDRIEDGGTFVLMYAPNAPERATAALRVDLLPIVDFGINSWRGDHWYGLVKALHTGRNLT